MTNPLHDLAREGVSVWLDDLSRERLVSGSLAAQIEDGTVVGVTTNPSIFKAAITGSHLYDEKVARYARAGADGVVRALTTEDVRDACDLLAPVYERTGGVDGRVSIEVAAVDARLEEIGTPEALDLRGKAAVANARLAYQAYEETFSGERWQRLKEAGAWPQRPLWASTGVKNPAYPDTLYVTELVAPGTVNTMPEATLRAVADHGEVRGDTIRPNYKDAVAVMRGLQEVGVDLADVTRLLEEQGVAQFETAWNELLESVDQAISATAAK